EDADAAAIVERRLRADGVDVVLGAHIAGVERRVVEIIVSYDVGGAARAVACDAVLIGAGRAPNVDGIGLEAAGVAYGRDRIAVAAQLGTTNPAISAAGDVATRFRFTHMADALARIVLANALFLGRRKVSALHVPWCTYTDPEVAHVGLSPDDARGRGIE